MSPPDDWSRHVAGIRHETTRPIRWQLLWPAPGPEVLIPRGFRFDVSIPRPLRWLIDPCDPRLLWAGCLHDYLRHVHQVDRRIAAGHFAVALAAGGVPAFQRWLMWAAVGSWRWR